MVSAGANGVVGKILLRSEIESMAQSVSRTVAGWLAAWWGRTPTDRYELQAGKLVHSQGERCCECIEPTEIDSWWVDREPVYDVVHIRLRSGQVLDWCDRQYDLLPLLTRCGIAAPSDAATVTERVEDVPTIPAP